MNTEEILLKLKEILDYLDKIIQKPTEIPLKDHGVCMPPPISKPSWQILGASV